MAETGAVFGGEHSAHYYFRDNFRADSGIIAALMVLEQLSITGLALSELRKPYERYAMSGEINTRVDDPAAVIERIAAAYSSAEQDRLDGLTVDLGDWWFNVRAEQHRAAPAAQPRSRRPRRLRRAHRRGARRRARHHLVNDTLDAKCGDEGARMTLDPKLLEILACPEDKGPLLYFEDESLLYNPRLHRIYAVKDDIPIMLIDEATAADDAEHARLVAKADADGIQPTFLIRSCVFVTDSLDFGEALCGLPEQLAHAHELAGKLPAAAIPARDDFDNVVVLGMGGSGVAGDVVQVVGTATLPVPLVVLKHYRTPAFVGPAHARVRGLVLG